MAKWMQGLGCLGPFSWQKLTNIQDRNQNNLPVVHNEENATTRAGELTRDVRDLKPRYWS